MDGVEDGVELLGELLEESLAELQARLGVCYILRFGHRGGVGMPVSWVAHRVMV